jgi:hypothetical protein
MSSNSAVSPEQAVTRDWVRLDDDVAARYGSVLEMKTAPIRLTGQKAARFTAAKQSRLPRTARPLPLD